MNYKKIIVLVLVISFIVISGCGDNKKTKEKVENKPNYSNNSELEPYQVDIYYYTDSVNKDIQIVEEECNKLLQDINTTVKLNDINGMAYADIKSNLFRANGKADLIFSASWNGFYQEVAKDQVLPLNDLLDKYGAGIKKNLSKEHLLTATINGKIYGIPTAKEFGAVYGLLFNKKLVDKYQFDITKVKSPKDLEPMLETIKNNEPEIIPYMTIISPGPWKLEISNSFESIGIDGSPGVLDYYADDYKVINQYELPIVKDLFKLAYEWAKKGYIKEEATSVNYDEVHRNGKFFCKWESLKPGKDKEMSAQYGIEYIQHSWYKPYASTREGTNALIEIGKGSKNPERAMMVLNRLYSDKKLINTLIYGIEGKHYRKIGDNMIDFPPGVNIENSTYRPDINWKIGNQFLNYLWANEDVNKWDNLKKFNDEAIKSRILGFNYDPLTIADLNNTIDVLCSKYTLLLECGKLDPEVGVPELNKELKAAGVDKLIAEKQRQIDEFVKNNKK